MIKKSFIKGFMAIIPILLTIALVIWVLNTIEGFTKPIIIWLIGPNYYFPSMSILFFVVVVFILGLLLNHWIVEKIYGKIEKIFKKMPLIKTLYGSIQDLLSLFKGDQSSMQKGVARVKIGSFYTLGIVTRDNYSDLPTGIGKENEVTVFIPLSYQIGGFTINVQREDLEMIDMPVEEALRFAVTAGMPGGAKKET